MNRLRIFKKKFIVLLLAFILLVVTFGGGYFAGQKKLLPIPTAGSEIINKYNGQPAGVDFSLFWEAWEKLGGKTVESVDPQKMIYGAISGAFSSLNDPFTVFLTPDENKRFREDIQGKFDGIGVEIISKNGLPTVVAPLSGTPAEKAGLKPNDIIAEVDGTKTDEISFYETINRIRGTKGTKVSLKIIRAGAEDPLSFEVERDTISVKSVELEKKELEGKIYYLVSIRQFSDDTSQLFDSIADQAVNEKPAGIIVDLRNNPGGYLETAIDVTSLFLDGGVVVIEEKKGGETKQYKVTKKARLKNFPTAVLVNNGSASASEIFSGALQDRKAGKIIGEKTFGKGSVQELIDLSDGSAAKITIAHWKTPSGRSISKEGVEPDITIANDEKTDEDEILNKALEVLAAQK